MATYMYKQVLEETKRLIGEARYIVVTVDEVIAVDNSSFLSVHVYIVQDWVRIPLFVSLQRVECTANAHNLTELIMGAVRTGGNLDAETVAKKLFSFGADDASTLQGIQTGVTLQMKEKHGPFMIGVHCMAHRCNLASMLYQALVFSLPLRNYSASLTIIFPRVQKGTLNSSS
jgi:hypothetical protein